MKRKSTVFPIDRDRMSLAVNILRYGYGKTTLELYPSSYGAKGLSLRLR